MARHVAAAVLALQILGATAAPLTESSPLARREPEGIAPLDGYTYQGCYSDDVAHRVLDTMHGDDEMTATACAALCPGSLYIGLQFGRECWCGPSLDPISALVEDQSSCNMPCAGDETTLCGAGALLTLYKKDGATGPTLDGYEAVSCYTDNVADRTLPYSESSAAMTIELCASIAAAGSFKYFGVEFGNECWYGNELGPLAVAADPTTCNKACAGNLAEVCGGPDRLNLYIAIEEDPVDPDAPFPYQPDDCHRVEDVNYNYRACLVRGFPAPTASITRTMYPTLEKCAIFCDTFSSFCNSFSFNAATKECTLYQEMTWEVVAPLTGSIAYKDIFISDRQCWVCPQPQ